MARDRAATGRAARLPELPEVETIRRGLEPILVGRRVEAATVVHPRSVRRQLGGPEGFVRELDGATVTAARRRGKFLWFPLGQGERALMAHLGMSGQFRWHRPTDPVHPHTRVVLTLDDGSELRFLDQRMFGALAVVGTLDGVPEPVLHIGLDVLDNRFDPAEAGRRLRAKRSTLKRTLLDQTLVSGIGNIYADESLWRLRRHPDTPTASLGPVQATRVWRTVTDVLTEAIAQGGTSFDALYVHVNGESGYFDRSLDAYGREGLPCRRCGTPMVREQFTNRSSFRCPRCQRLR